MMAWFIGFLLLLLLAGCQVNLILINFLDMCNRSYESIIFMHADVNVLTTSFVNYRVGKRCSAYFRLVDNSDFELDLTFRWLDFPTYSNDSCRDYIIIYSGNVTYGPYCKIASVPNNGTLSLESPLKLRFVSQCPPDCDELQQDHGFLFSMFINQLPPLETSRNVSKVPDPEIYPKDRKYGKLIYFPLVIALPVGIFIFYLSWKKARSGSVNISNDYEEIDCDFDCEYSEDLRRTDSLADLPMSGIIPFSLSNKKLSRTRYLRQIAMTPSEVRPTRVQSAPCLRFLSMSPPPRRTRIRFADELRDKLEASTSASHVFYQEPMPCAACRRSKSAFCCHNVYRLDIEVTRADYVDRFHSV